MIAPAITAPQLRRLQVLYGQYERHSLDCPGSDRASRLQWAAKAIGREVASFKQLTRDEARRLIDILQGTMQVKAPNKTPRRMSRKLGQKLGTEGRKDQIHAETTLVSAENLALIQRDLDRLGWDVARMERFAFSSARSPLRGKTQIRTLADANKLHWALKNLKPDTRKDSQLKT